MACSECNEKSVSRETRQLLFQFMELVCEYVPDHAKWTSFEHGEMYSTKAFVERFAEVRAEAERLLGTGTKAEAKAVAKVERWTNAVLTGPNFRSEGGKK